MNTSIGGQPVPSILQPAINPLFHLGQLLATPGALRTLAAIDVHPLSLIRRHVTGDWGDLCEVDRQANAVAIEYGSRIFSSYKLPRPASDEASTETVWVITEATDGSIGGPRQCTTILLPSEY